jgi:C4-dicarboxylate transporter DctQ subunit
MNHDAPHRRTAFGRAVNGLEETIIAVLLGLMTVITFVNVPIRYLFDGITLPRVEFLWAVEMTEWE